MYQNLNQKAILDRLIKQPIDYHAGAKQVEFDLDRQDEPMTFCSQKRNDKHRN
ncbi:hypothetical protein [Pantanalinema sp. GBBB05]|uniref:hypothetical protein n=1 Tax=Pantanalinema sp. GBBB05 TaxID=2604139 RepID=UPI003D81BCA7